MGLSWEPRADVENICEERAGWQQALAWDAWARSCYRWVFVGAAEAGLLAKIMLLGLISLGEKSHWALHAGAS